MILFDQHVHSIYSPDSSEPIENYIKKVVKDNQEYFVITDHCDVGSPNQRFSFMSDFLAEKKEIEELNKKYPSIKIMQGIEIGYNGVLFDSKDLIIKDINPSVINLSIHYHGTLDFYEEKYTSLEQIHSAMVLYLKDAIEAASTYTNYDVFSHIDYGFKNAWLQNNSIKFTDYEDLVKEFFKVIIKKDKVLEINTKVQGILNDQNCSHLRYLLRLYKSVGGSLLTISSDAHSVSRYKDGFDRFIKVIKEEGFDSLCYFIDRERFTYSI